MSVQEKELDPMLAATYGDDYQTTGIDPIEPEDGLDPDDDDLEPEEPIVDDVPPVDPEAEPAIDPEEDDLPPAAETPAEPEVPAEPETPEEPVTPATPAPVVPTLTNEARALIEKLNAGDDKELYEMLKKKHGFAEMGPEDKMVNYLVATRPELDANDIHFLLASDYGVGATEIDEYDLTPEMQASLNRQKLARKTLLRQAETFFEEQASSVKFPEVPALTDVDPEYKAYLEFKEKELALQPQREAETARLKEVEQTTLKQVNTTATEIDKFSVDVSLELDKGKFDLSTDFKLSDKMKKQLADYTVEYTPTQAEIQQHTKDGEFDMKGYMTQLAQRLFSPQIQKALIKQAIVKDREQFISTELKNSSFGRGERAQADVEVDPTVRAMGL
ncbi:hypothetical protein [Sphingobacterium mizutaii]|uniref:hypothetical protein n=1 Tax=Sphingobacterium mizutaii TaxID=1010 RepID=UPI00289A8361|nr:hypothetical protein [Sphingobacterium mizutaii]